MTHAPGPWQIVVMAPSGYDILDSQCRVVASAWGDNEANANLIAAAPDMLIVLESILDWHRELYNCNHDCSCVHGLPIDLEIAVETVITKAKGE